MTIQSKFYVYCTLVYLLLNRTANAKDNGVFSDPINGKHPALHVSKKVGEYDNYQSFRGQASIDGVESKTTKIAGFSADIVFSVAIIFGAVFSVWGLYQIVSNGKDNQPTKVGWITFMIGIVLMALGSAAFYSAAAFTGIFD